MTTTFGERLRQLRQAAGLSQGELAGDDLSSSYISLLESGKRSPSTEVAQQLAARLGCSTSQLVEGRPSERDERITSELAFARLAIEHGEAEAARTRLTRLLAEDGLTLRARDDISFQLGVAHGRCDDPHAALQVFLPLFERAQIGESHVLVTLLGLGLCSFYLEAGDLNQAVQVGESALAAAESRGLADTDEYYRLAATVMHAYMQRGDDMHARIWAERMLERAQSDQRAAGQGALYWNLALLAEQDGRLADARQLCEMALGRLSELESTRDYARLRLDLAIILLNHTPPDHAHALDLLRRCESDLDDLGAPADKALWHWASSLATLFDGDPVAAEVHARQSLSLAKGDPDAQSDAWQALSDALAAQHRDEQAADCRRRALEALKQVQGTGRGAALTWRELGERLVQDDPVAALDAMRSALDAAGLRNRGEAKALQIMALRSRPHVPVARA